MVSNLLKNFQYYQLTIRKNLFCYWSVLFQAQEVIEIWDLKKKMKFSLKSIMSIQSDLSTILQIMKVS